MKFSGRATVSGAENEVCDQSSNSGLVICVHFRTNALEEGIHLFFIQTMGSIAE